jgi:hypothetical protein
LLCHYLPQSCYSLEPTCSTFVFVWCSRVSVFRISAVSYSLLIRLLCPFVTDLEGLGSDLVAAKSAAPTFVLLCRSFSAQPSSPLPLYTNSNNHTTRHQQPKIGLGQHWLYTNQLPAIFNSF